MARVYLGLGSNLGGRQANLRQALRLLEARGIRVVRASSLYETAPVLEPGAPAQSDYLNAVIEISTELEPPQLLKLVKLVEAQAGRRPTRRWAPRVLDVDILLYAERCLQLPDLELPHPRLHLRRFVVEPLAELGPELTHPVSGQRMRELLDELPLREQEVRRFAGPEWVRGAATVGATGGRSGRADERTERSGGRAKAARRTDVEVRAEETARAGQSAVRDGGQDATERSASSARRHRRGRGGNRAAGGGA